MSQKNDSHLLEIHLAETREFNELLNHYVEKGPGIKPIRPEFLAATLSEIASADAMFFADTGTACIWLARHIKGGTKRRLFGSFSWASMASAAPNAFGAQLAYPGRQTIAFCGDGGFTMLALGDLLTQVQRKAPVVQIILNNESLDFVNIEQEEAGTIPFGVKFENPNFARVAEAMGAKGIRIEEPGDVRDGLAEALGPQGWPRRRCGSRSFRPLATVACSFPHGQGLHSEFCQRGMERKDGRSDQGDRTKRQAGLSNAAIAA